MPPDIQGLVNKFLPNNPPVASVVGRVLKNVFQTSTLPIELVKQIVERALEQTRMDMKADSAIFEEKLTSYANQLRPRYLAKINEIRKRGKKW